MIKLFPALPIELPTDVYSVEPEECKCGCGSNSADYKRGFHDGILE